MSVHVSSETGALKKVMLHRPGAELEKLLPGELERLLFDDIPYLKTARAEHDTFAAILKKEGAEVVYLEDLMAETLDTGKEIRASFIRDFVEEGGASAGKFKEQLIRYLEDIPDTKELVLKTMAGVTFSELKDVHSPLVDLLKSESRFLLDPLPNLYFTRDPFTVVGDGICLNRMYSATRRRETIYASYIFRYHPAYKDVKQYYRRDDPFSLEGGDLLNLNASTIAIGISQRTSPEAVELLASRLFFQDETETIQSILAFDIPAVRAFMHLDTVFTQLDQNRFTVHPGILGSLRVFRITRGEQNASLMVRELEGSLGKILEQELNCGEVTLIKCGGSDRIASEREQWNDASNTLCVSPGIVIVYDRNDVTNAILREHGIRVLEMPSSELSRGRGGPRCMSMPLCRS